MNGQQSDTANLDANSNLITNSTVETDLERNQAKELNSDSDSSIVGGTANNFPNKLKKKYKQKFSLNFLSEFKWASQQDGSTVCTLCNIKISGGAFHLRRHANSSNHVSNIKKISNSPSITESMKKLTLKDSV